MRTKRTLSATIAGAARTVAGSSFYGMLTEADRALLRGQGAMKTYLPESELMLEGSPAACVTILVRGWAKSSFTAVTGRRIVLRIYGPGDLFGSEAISDDRRCPETVTAMVPCLALTLPGSCFAEMLSSNSHLAGAFRYLMGCRTQAAEEQAKAVFRSPGGRLARVLLDLADRHGVQAPDGITIPVELSQAELAGMIGVSRSTVARALSNLRRQGIIHTGYRRITVTALKPLRAIADGSLLTKLAREKASRSRPYADAGPPQPLGLAGPPTILGVGGTTVTPTPPRSGARHGARRRLATLLATVYLEGKAERKPGRRRYGGIRGWRGASAKLAAAPRLPGDNLGGPRRSLSGITSATTVSGVIARMAARKPGQLVTGPRQSYR